MRSARAAAVTALHAGVLVVLGWVGGGPRWGWVVGGVVGWQLAESAVAVDRPGAGDAGAQVIGLTVLASIAASLVLPGDAGGWALAGVAVAVGGVALRLWAVRTLGVGFGDGVVPLVPRVRRGPYRHLDHPADVGMLVAVLGFALAAGSVAGGVGALALAALLAARGRAEARAWRTFG